MIYLKRKGFIRWQSLFFLLLGQIFLVLFFSPKMGRFEFILGVGYQMMIVGVLFMQKI